MSNNAHELSNRLLNALDNNYNVVDMHTVNEIISILEKFNITKELLETTRLGKHVNELRRKTTDPSLARRAKVLVKRWRDLVIPTVASPGHTGSNRSSAERSVRRLGGTPLTSPALSRQVVSPAVPSPRPLSRPAWGGYESDSQDVILVDDDPPAPPPLPAPSPLAAVHKPLTPPVKRPPSPEPLFDEKKAKRDKKPKKRRGHSRAGSGAESGAGGAGAAWRDRNGAPPAPDRRRNGCRKGPLDPYAAMVNRMPKVGDKKVKTTKELLEQIQSRGRPASPHSPDVMLIEDKDTEPCLVKVDSPLRNGGSSPRAASPARSPLPPLEDEREYHECTCGDTPEENCPAARKTEVHPLHVFALHNVHLPGINGTRAPPHPHQFAVRKPIDPDKPGLFSSIVPLYKYSDYADDYCAKNMSKVPLCTHLPWTEFAPAPPELPPPKSPPPLRPYPIDDPPKTAEPNSDTDEEKVEVKLETVDVKLETVEVKREIVDAPETVDVKSEIDVKCAIVEAEMVGVPSLEPSERLKAPILSPEDETHFVEPEPVAVMEVEEAFETKHQDHRTVERTKEDLNGRVLFEECSRVIDSIPYDYEQIHSTPVVSLPQDEYQAIEALEEGMTRAEADTARDALGRPLPPDTFSEWHECARLGELIALPYVVID